MVHKQRADVMQSIFLANHSINICVPNVSIKELDNSLTGSLTSEPQVCEHNYEQAKAWLEP